MNLSQVIELHYYVCHQSPSKNITLPDSNGYNYFPGKKMSLEYVHFASG